MPPAPPPAQARKLPKPSVFSTSATMRLHVDQGVAVIQPTRMMLCIGLIFLAISAVPWGFAVKNYLHPAGTPGHVTGHGGFSMQTHGLGGIDKVLNAATNVKDVAVPAIAGLVFTLVGLLLTLSMLGRKAIFDPANQSLAIRAGFLGRKRDEVALQDIASLEVLETSQSMGKGWQLNLVLSRPPGRRVPLMNHGKERVLRDDARRLAQFLKLPVAELSLAQQGVQFGDWTLSVPHTPVAKNGSRSRTHQLVSRGPDELALVPSMSSRIASGVIVAMGALAAAGGIVLLMKGLWARGYLVPGAIALTVGGIFLLVGILSFRLAQRITFNREGIWFKPARKGLEVPLRGVRAIQVLRNWATNTAASAGQSNSYTCYEINLVLGEAAQRVNLISQGNANATRRAAEQIAEFLGVPFLNHIE